MVRTVSDIIFHRAQRKCCWSRVYCSHFSGTRNCAVAAGARRARRTTVINNSIAEFQNRPSLSCPSFYLCSSVIEVVFIAGSHCASFLTTTSYFGSLGMAMPCVFSSSFTFIHKRTPSVTVLTLFNPANLCFLPIVAPFLECTYRDILHLI